MDPASLALPALRLLDPETAHGLVLRGLALGLGGYRSVASLPLRAMGLDFANPLGLAAGFDKDARAVRPLLALGFGFVEIGTVTPLPQPGNPRPRLFRLKHEQAVINRMGFPSEGWERVAARLAALRDGPRLGGPLGVNIGPNKDAPRPEASFAQLAVAAAPFADYLVINVSSPNTQGLRALQAADRLAGILDAVSEALARQPKAPPLLVKIAPDLDAASIEAVVETALRLRAAGLVVSNTTLSRPASLVSPARAETGGLSGQPLFEPATEALRIAATAASGRLVLVGAGGIASAEQAYAKLRAGASLLQLYTGFAWQGPRLIATLLDGLAALLARDGFGSVADAVGADLPARVAA